jgi:hypothetical protein
MTISKQDDEILLKAGMINRKVMDKLLMKQKSELKTQILDKINELSYPCPCSDTDCHTQVIYADRFKIEIKEIFE